ncbi:MAG TPA: hypothetical protein VFU81_04345, partial [Thermomicrobiales bacterium]|nr:hypothetical protein [Thermomicrobiales bacterium]
MDERSFDALARAVSSGASRRQALRFLAAGALAGSRPWSGHAAPARQADGCAPGLTYCAEQPNWAPAGCYDLSADYLQCGDCMHQCPSAGPVKMACVGGACVATDCGDLTDCTGNLDCTSLSGDPNNCGACGNVCASGVCTAGSCAGGCGEGLAYCPAGADGQPAGCFDLFTDQSHCGACDIQCTTATVTCVTGQCVPPPCDEGLAQCAAGCVDLNSDPNNCGACGNACASGGCSAGSCIADDTTCAAGLTYCPAKQISVGFDSHPEDLPAGCFDLSSNNTHCGSCDITCPSTVPCYGGQCTLPPCEEGLSRCGAGCVDFLSDPNYCGACDVVCASGVCDGGTCTHDTTCATGLTYCSAKTGSVSQEAGCYDLSSDYYHCGACDATCPIASPGPVACIEGQCQKHCDPPRTLCENPASIHPDYCADVNSDPENCGACGNVCASGACDNGSCAPVAANAAPQLAGSAPTAAPTAAPNAGVSAEAPLVLQTDDGASVAQPSAAPTATGDGSDATGSGGISDAGGTSRAPRSRGRSAAGQTAKSGAAATPKSTLGWPFDPQAGPWT